VQGTRREDHALINRSISRSLLLVNRSLSRSLLTLTPRGPRSYVVGAQRNGVCVCMCLYVGIHTQTRSRTHIYTHTHTHTCMWAYTHIHTHTHTAQIYRGSPTQWGMYVSRSPYIYIYRCVHTDGSFEHYRSYIRRQPSSIHVLQCPFSDGRASRSP
jgi:hypothetical protein